VDVLDLAGAGRVHVHVALPGLPGEGDRVKRAIAALDPAILILDLDTHEALSLRKEFQPGFVDALAADALNQRFAKGDKAGDHPFVVAARQASARKAELVALRPHGKAPGFFARRRAVRAVAALAHDDPAAFARAVPAALAGAQAWDAREDERAGVPRVERALQGGRAPVVLVTSAHRADALFAALAEARP